MLEEGGSGLVSNPEEIAEVTEGGERGRGGEGETSYEVPQASNSRVAQNG